jgi:butyryl-CoA dehydrogenase
MDFQLSEEQEMIRQMVREFAEQEVAPYVEQWEEEETIPWDIFKKLAELGLLAMEIPERYGGAELDNISYVLAIEQLARVSASLAVVVSVTNSVCCYPILKFGTEKQREKYLVPLARGDFIGGFSLTEPQAGSDASNQRTKAVKNGDFYMLNGTKAWVTNGQVGKLFIIMARTNQKKDKAEISAFIVEDSFSGFSFGKAENKMGLRSSKTSEIILEQCQVPQENILGKEGEGLKIALHCLDSARLGIAAQSIGIAQAALEQAVSYAKQREAFGRPLVKFQAIQFYLADMATRIEAARHLLFRAAYLRSKGKEYSKESSMAKLYASEMANWVTAQALQIHGAYGYSKEYPVERYYRDARVLTIYEGTSEVQRIVIARGLLR